MNTSSFYKGLQKNITIYKYKEILVYLVLQAKEASCVTVSIGISTIYINSKKVSK